MRAFSRKHAAVAGISLAVFAFAAAGSTSQSLTAATGICRYLTFLPQCRQTPRSAAPVIPVTPVVPPPVQTPVGPSTRIEPCPLPPNTTGIQCGNGKVESGEQCDDGNTHPNDGCHNCMRVSAPQPPADPVFSTDSGVLGQVRTTHPTNLAGVQSVSSFVVSDLQEGQEIQVTMTPPSGEAYIGALNIGPDGQSHGRIPGRTNEDGSLTITLTEGGDKDEDDDPTTLTDPLGGIAAARFHLMNKNPAADGTDVPVGVASVGQFGFQAGPNSNTAVGFLNMLLNIDAENIQVNANGVRFLNKANPTVTRTCILVDAAGTVLRGPVTINERVHATCSRLRDPSAYSPLVNTEVDPNTSQVFVLQLEILNPRVVSSQDSALQVSLNKFWDRDATDYSIDDSHVEWRYRGSNESFFWINWLNEPQFEVKSTRYGSAGSPPPPEEKWCCSGEPGYQCSQIAQSAECPSGIEGTTQTACQAECVAPPFSGPDAVIKFEGLPPNGGAIEIPAGGPLTLNVIAANRGTEPIEDARVTIAGIQPAMDRFEGPQGFNAAGGQIWGPAFPLEPGQERRLTFKMWFRPTFCNAFFHIRGYILPNDENPNNVAPPSPPAPAQGQKISVGVCPVAQFTVTNANPDANGTAVPTGVAPVGQFTFAAGQNGSPAVTFGKLIFNVQASNVRVANPVFYNKSNPSVRGTCRFLDLSGVGIDGETTGTLHASCLSLNAAGVNTSIASGTDQTFVLAMDVRNPQISTSQSSKLEVSLTSFSNRSATIFGVAGSHVEWFRSGSAPVLWIDFPRATVQSTTYDNGPASSSSSTGGEPTASCPIYSPDYGADMDDSGRFVTFSADMRPGSYEGVFVFDRETGKVTSVTIPVSLMSNTQGVSPEISGDGNAVIFPANYFGVQYRLMRYSRADSSLGPITQANEPAGFYHNTSRNGRRIVYSSNYGSIHLYDADTAKTLTIAGGERPVPMGAIPVGIGAPILISDSVGRDPGISPNGSLVAFATNDGIYLFDVNRSTATKITSSANKDAPVRFSGDGRYILHSRAALFDRQTNAHVPVSLGEGWTQTLIYAMSNDANILLMWGRQPSPVLGGGDRYVVFNRATNEKILFTQQILTLSGDGKAVVIANYPSFKVHNLATSEVTEIPREAMCRQQQFNSTIFEEQHLSSIRERACSSCAEHTINNVSCRTIFCTMTVNASNNTVCNAVPLTCQAPRSSSSQAARSSVPPAPFCGDGICNGREQAFCPPPPFCPPGMSCPRPPLCTPCPRDCLH